MEDLSNLHFFKGAYYEEVTRLARWISILLVLLTFPFAGGKANYYTILLLILTASAYNALRYWPPIMRLPVFSSKLTILIVDAFFILSLSLLSGGLNSPYYLFYGLSMISATFWYGSRGVFFFGLYVTGATAALVIITDNLLSLNAAREIVAKVAILIVGGFLVDRFTQAERKERFRALETSYQAEIERQQLLALINSQADGVIALDNKGSITLYNGAALEFLNTNLDLVGKSIDKLVKLEDTNDQAQTVMGLATASQGIVKRDDLVYLSNEGSKLSIDLSISPIHAPYSDRRSAQGYILIMRDITKEKTLDEQRDEFISVASHELRTPLAIAEANISTALMPKFSNMDPQAQELIKQAHQNIVFLGDLIKDLTTLSKAEEGSIKLEISTVDSNLMLRQLVQDYRAEAENKGLKLVLNLEDKLPPIITSENAVHEILQNFLTNAIKYTQKGSVTISAEPVNKGKEGLVFNVKDTGIGVSASDKKHLFTKFYRSEDYRTRQTGGTGLGLYITKKLAERLNGKIWFSSKLNHGSTFYLQVPPYSQLTEDHKQVVEAQMSNFVETI